MSVLTDPSVQKALLWVIGVLLAAVSGLIGVIVKHILADLHMKDNLDNRVTVLETNHANFKEDIDEIKKKLDKLLERQ